MARAFRAERGRVAGSLESYEVAILRSLVGDVVGLISATDLPGNAVTDRLFPDPSPDPETARAVRDLIGEDLRAAKIEAARTLLTSLPESGRFILERDDAEQWLTALNDVRLALGTAIGVTEDVYDRDTEDEQLQVYQWLSFLLESLVEALSSGG
jgi:hypothetical protein